MPLACPQLEVWPHLRTRRQPCLYQLKYETSFALIASASFIGCLISMVSSAHLMHACQIASSNPQIQILGLFSFFFAYSYIFNYYSIQTYNAIYSSKSRIIMLSTGLIRLYWALHELSIKVNLQFTGLYSGHYLG